MSKVRVLIVEDDQEQAEDLQDYLEEKGYEVTAVANTLVDALGYFYSQQPDMVVLDIFLNGEPDGIRFAQKMNENENTLRPFIFLTSHVDESTFAEAKLTAPFSYLVKPFNPLELQFAIDLALEKFANEKGAFSVDKKNSLVLDRDLFIKSGNSLVKVPFSEIIYVEVDGKYCNVVTASGQYVIQWPLKKLADKLPQPQFIRVHRNYIVHTPSILKIHMSEHMVMLKNDKSIPFSQNYREDLLSSLDILK